MESKKDFRRLLIARFIKKVNFLSVKSSSGRRVLKIAEVKVYGNEAHASLDSEAVLKILSKSFGDRLSIIEKDRNKRITVANGVKYAVLDLLTAVLAAFDYFIVPLNFLVV